MVVTVTLMYYRFEIQYQILLGQKKEKEKEESRCKYGRAFSGPLGPKCYIFQIPNSPSSHSVMPMLEHLEELDPGHFGSRLYLDFLAKELD